MRRRWHGNQPPGRLSTGPVRRIQPAAGAGADDSDFGDDFGDEPEEESEDEPFDELDDEAPSLAPDVDRLSVR